MLSRIWQVLTPFLAALALFMFLTLAFGAGTGGVELALFLVVSVLFGWWVARAGSRKRHSTRGE